MAGDLARFYQDLEMLSRASAEDLQSIEGIGPNIAEAIVDWFARPANRHILEKLRSNGVWPKSGDPGCKRRCAASLRVDLCHHWNIAHALA